MINKGLKNIVYGITFGTLASIGILEYVNYVGDEIKMNYDPNYQNGKNLVSKILDVGEQENDS